MKCSNKSNQRRLVSVKVPRITDVSLLCYRFQSERITETAKRSNVVNFLDSILSHLGLLKPNRDILASRRQRSGFRDRVSQTGTVLEKPGRLVSLLEREVSPVNCVDAGSVLVCLMSGYYMSSLLCTLDPIVLNHNRLSTNLEYSGISLNMEHSGHHWGILCNIREKL